MEKVHSGTDLKLLLFELLPSENGGDHIRFYSDGTAENLTTGVKPTVFYWTFLLQTPAMPGAVYYTGCWMNSAWYRATSLVQAKYERYLAGLILGECSETLPPGVGVTRKDFQGLQK